MTEQIELTPELLAVLKAQASEWNRSKLTYTTMPFNPRVVLALIAAYEGLEAECDQMATHLDGAIGLLNDFVHIDAVHNWLVDNRYTTPGQGRRDGDSAQRKADGA